MVDRREVDLPFCICVSVSVCVLAHSSVFVCGVPLVPRPSPSIHAYVYACIYIHACIYARMITCMCRGIEIDGYSYPYAQKDSQVSEFMVSHKRKECQGVGTADAHARTRIRSSPFFKRSAAAGYCQSHCLFATKPLSPASYACIYMCP